jgi:hypothetical protein
MEDFDFDLMTPDLDFGPVAEAGEEASSNFIWVAILVVGILLGAFLYLALKEEHPKRKQL